jgi:hypothetical protein
LSVARPPSSPADELSRAAELLFKYWILAIPTAVASLLVMVIVIVAVLSVVATVLAGHATAGHTGAAVGLGTGLLIAAALFFAGMAGLYVAQGMVMAAAPAVLEDRPPDLAAAFRITLARLPDLGVAGVLTLALAIVPLALCFVLIGFPLLLLLGYFLMYVPAAVVVGNEGGVAAIQTSFRIASTRIGESAIAWLGMFLAFVAGAIANSIAIHIPLVNLLAGFAVGGFTSAYSALLSVQFYLTLRDGGAPPAMQSPQPSPVPGAQPYGGPPSIIR